MTSLTKKRLIICRLLCIALCTFWFPADSPGYPVDFIKAHNQGGLFGTSSALSGDTLVVGVPDEGSGTIGINGGIGTDYLASGSGAAFVYVRQNGRWVQEAYLKASDISGAFGTSVAISGDTIVIGAPTAGRTGAAYVFVRNGSDWVQQAQLTALNADNEDEFGQAVAISGDTIAVSAQTESSAASGVDGDMDDNSLKSAGAVYVFERAANDWTQQAYLKASNPSKFDRFGNALALDGGTLAVGAAGEDGGSTAAGSDPSDNTANASGAVYIFERGGGGGWAQEAYLKAGHISTVAGFGFSVSLSSGTLLVGANSEDGLTSGVGGDETQLGAQGADSGAAYVFVRGAGSWAQQAYLKASNAEIGDEFGQAVALNGDVAVVGTPFEASSSSGDPNDNSAPEAGAVYIFERVASAWSETAFLKAPVPEAEDSYGTGLALSGSWLSVGAPMEESYSRGVGGDVTNNDRGGAGGAFLYQLDAPPTARLNVSMRGGAGLVDGISTIQFGPVCVGDTGPEFEIVLWNNGDLPLTGLAASVIDTDAGAFVLDDAALPATLDPNASAIISISQRPLTPLVTSVAVLRLTSTGRAPFEVGLRGVTPLQIAQQAYLKASSPEANARLGESVAVEGSTMVIASPGLNLAGSQSGAVFVFELEEGFWHQRAMLQAPNPDARDNFGASVAISGDTLVVGADGEASAANTINGDDLDNSAFDAGAVYVFVRNGDQWQQQAYIKASNAESGDEFGISVDIDGDVMIVGASCEESGADTVNGDQNDNATSDAGAAYIFVRNAGVWTQQAYLKAPNSDDDDHFGFAVAIDDSTVVVGALHEDSYATGVDGDIFDNRVPSSGAAYVYVQNGGGWELDAYLKPSGRNSGQFGQSVDISGDSIIVGAYLDSIIASGVEADQTGALFSSGSGAAYIFVRDSGSGWRQQSYLKPVNLATGQRFGGSVAISGDTVAVGGARDAGASSGIVCDFQMPRTAIESGAVHIFTRQGERWDQRGLIKPPIQQHLALFGAATAISGTTVIVGSSGDDGGSGGVNGDPAASAQVQRSGAAYVFDIDAPHAWSAYWTATAAAGLVGDSASPTATPFGDGVSNLEKYAFGGPLDSPASAPAGGSAIGITDAAGETYLRFDFLRRVGAGLIYTPQFTADLAEGSWTSLTGSASVMPAGAGWERVIYDQPIDSAAMHYFGRFKLDLPVETGSQ